MTTNRNVIQCLPLFSLPVIVIDVLLAGVYLVGESESRGKAGVDFGLETADVVEFAFGGSASVGFKVEVGVVVVITTTFLFFLFETQYY